MPGRRVERVPSVVEGFASPVVPALTLIIFGTFAFVSGNNLARLASLASIGLIGGGASFITLGYWLYRPLNFFSGNFYAPKPFRRLTEGELRALGYLNSLKGRLLTMRIALVTIAVPLLGGTVCKLGLWCVGEGHDLGSARFHVITTCVGLTLLNYNWVTCMSLKRRWDWILEHQPLPDAEVLAKYSKGKVVGQWEHLYGTEFSEEMNRALEGRPGRGFWRMILQVLGGGAAALAAFRLISGDVLEERRVGAVLILGAGVLICWLAGRYLKNGDPENG